ncbi:MAG: LacI family DNA-binding transcriptional regulator [Ignavibacteriae bacterium]|nr:LacI family DNA-binding transcriptional regulator [Ignavibacteriota bacterium]MCB9208836.1 LacI family DNA-binding transcriptional regulator [Ignavibacteriales bacterium]MCB9218246.1 LacI family DNA-binding transcriptional regulator [Ignavibacteriales bacterium]MCB9260541.1 LacI family DNA-binding transcriptional regulator [Ignavibacteriales bacterium]
MAPTLKDVAAHVGVHPSTVSRVLRGKENLKISAKTHDKILKAVKELNYIPDFTARALRMKKSFTIGLIVPDILNPYFARIARRIEQLGFEKKYTVIVCNTDEDQQKEILFLNQLISRGVDGIIIAPVQDSKEHIVDVIDKNIPLVLIDRIFEDINVNSVITNNAESVMKAVTHLVKLGHKRIAFLRGQKNIYTIKNRLAGYKEALKEFNLSLIDNYIVGEGFEFEDGYEATLKLLALPKLPTAIVSSGGDLVTLGAIKAIYEKGLKIPEDISIIAFFDSLYSPFLATPLTTITHYRQKIGEKAFKLLLKQIESSKDMQAKTICVDTKFELRDSTAKPKN